MDYLKHYKLLINRAKSRSLVGCTESHHILPRCIGGTDDKSNLVNLTPEEHYLAHQLLVKIYPNNYSLIYAANMMVPNRKSNKYYGWLKRKFAATVSNRQRGTGNSQFGTKWVHNQEQKISKKISIDHPIEDGWSLGRIINFDKKPKQQLTKSELYQKRRKEGADLANKLFDNFINSTYTSVCEFAKATGTTQPRLCMLWKKHVPAYNAARAHGKSFKPL